MASRRFVIGDIHGCSRTFRHLVTRRIMLTPADTLYLVGDLVDRGPDSKGVLDFVMELNSAGFRVLPIRGNHEEMMIQAGFSKQALSTWLNIGGQPVLESFGVQQLEEIPAGYLDLIRSFPYLRQTEEFIIVHAGVNYEAHQPLADLEALLWSRPYRTDVPLVNGKRIICGHTVVSQAQIRASLSGNLILLDNGCVYGPTKPGMGCLTALNLDTLELEFQPNIDG